MFNILRIWILFSTLLISAGWILLALHQLNRSGFGVCFLLAAVVFIDWQQKAKCGRHRS